MRKWSNWRKTMIVLAVLLVLMLNPMTRQLILLILPMGSGVDDLVFFAIFFAVLVMLMMRTMAAKQLLKIIAEWFMK